MDPLRRKCPQAVVLNKRIITYWKKADPLTVHSHRESWIKCGQEVETGAPGEGKAQAEWICEKTGINLAAFDLSSIRTIPISAFYSRNQLLFWEKRVGGSLRYYRLLLKAFKNC